MWNYCLTSTEFQCGKMKRVGEWRWMVVMVAEECECTYVAELHLKIIKMVNLHCVYFTTFLEKCQSSAS